MWLKLFLALRRRFCVDNSVTAPLLERYQRLTEISQELASTLELEILLDRIVHAAADLSNAEAASILLYDQDHQQLQFEAATNLEEPMMRGLIVPVNNSLAGWIVMNRQPVIIDNTEEDPRHFGHISKVTNITTKSLLGVPLITKDKVVGVLEAINKRSGAFDKNDENIMTALGAQVAVAIENARLFQQSDLISELVHELRTPLASLSTAAHLLLRPEVSEDQRVKMVQIIHDETFRLSEMTTAFLDLARLESGRARFQAEVFAIKDVLEDCAVMMRSRAHEKGISLNLEIQDKMPSISADRNKIKQVIINLLSNAIKYNRPGGVITLTAQAARKEIVISVRDTGPGIIPEVQEHLFEKFYRAPGSENQVQGTGLGLAICKRIVDAHQGRIEVSSTAGMGSTFTVHLPLKPRRI
jgi:signal transduction histidine kinase